MSDGFGTLLRTHRERLGLSVSRVAELVGKTPTTVRGWEKGKGAPSEPGVIRSLAAVLAIDEERLFQAAGMERVDQTNQTTIEQALASLRPPPVEEVWSPPQPPSVPASEPEPAEEPQPVAAAVSAPSPPPAPTPVSPPPAAPAYQVTAGLPVPPPPPPRPLPSSYLEDPAQRDAYRVRSLLTAIGFGLLLLALVWAVGELAEAVDQTWDAITGAA